MSLMRDKFDRDADSLIEFAHTTLYQGPPIQGDIYCGWPVKELLDIVPSSDRSSVAAALQRKVRPLMAFPAPVLPLAQAVMPSSRPHSLEEMMAMRMRWGAFMPGAIATWAVGFTHMAMHKAGDKVYVWIITKDCQSVVLEDEYELYPSDALITKIRLLQRGDEG